MGTADSGRPATAKDIMSRTSSRPRAKVNLPLIALWVASVAAAVIGYLLMTMSNTNQAALYTSQTGDYGKLFAAQSGSTVGGLLIAVGVLGVLLALASQVIARTKVATPEAVVADSSPTDIDYDEHLVDPTIDLVVPVDEPATDAAAPAASDERAEKTVAAR